MWKLSSKSIADAGVMVVGCCGNLSFKIIDVFISFYGGPSAHINEDKEATVEPFYNGHLWGPTFCPL